MTTVVTGGAGFLGSHLVELLEADGQDVHIVRKADCDLTDANDVARLYEEVPGSSVPPGGRGRRHRRQP